MASKVYLHIGPPKTGTTYLQTVMWSSREKMREQGVLLPGRERRDHLWATRVIREDPKLDNHQPKVHTSWERLKEEIADWPGAAVISHEFFAGADRDQAERMMADLAPAELHLVVTAREPLGLLSGGWQETTKNRDTRPFFKYADAPVSTNPMAVWNWRTLDVRLVLERWSPTLPPERVHVVTVPPPGSPRDLLWQRFAGVVGLDAGSFDLGATFPNESMGLAEVETLRRVNLHLQTEEFESAWSRGVFIRTYLADERLVPRRGDKYWPDELHIEQARVRAREAVDYIRAQGFDVVGDLETLLVAETLEPRRAPDSVTDSEVAEIATELVGSMLHDIRRLRMERNEVRRKLETELARPEVGVREALGKRWPWLERFVKRK